MAVANNGPRFAGDSVQAGFVVVGDILANIGVVTDVTNIGVFVVFGVRGTVRRLCDGRMDVEKFDVVRHQAETVVLDIVR